MNTRAKLSDLTESLQFSSDGYVLRYDREQGRTVMTEQTLLSALEEGRDEKELLMELPDWQQEQVQIAKAILEDANDRFIDPPSKFDFHEYRHMERFIGSLDDASAADQLWRAIKRPGAFRSFKGTAARLNLLQRWYEYRDAAMKQFVIGWAEDNDVPYEDDLVQR
jgi:hypothetical protein